jgi:hypothetical protein
MSVDFSDYTGLVPAGTVAVLQARIRYGDGTDNVLKRTKAGDAEGLDFELTVLEGPYLKQKVFWFALVKGETDGQKSMAEKNRATLKKVIDSNKFLDPNDRSPEARAKRTVNWRDFDNLKFLGEIGIEEGRNGFPDKNILARVITRDMPQWNGRPPFDQNPPDHTSGGPTGGAAPAPITKPPWAS